MPENHRPAAARRFLPVLLLLLLGLGLIQAALVWSADFRPQLGLIRRFGLVQAFERGEILYIGGQEASYVRFVNALLPKDAPVVLPDAANALFTDQSLMQFYLFPRPIWDCPGLTSAQCKQYASDPRTYLLALKDFPPAELTAGKVFIPFPGSDGPLKGVYAPADQAAALHIPDPASYGRTPAISPWAPLLEGGTLLLFFLLGCLFVSLILPQPGWLETAALSLPLSMGLVSWGLFLASDLGLPLGRWTLLGWVVLLVALGLGAHRLLRRPFGARSWREPFRQVRSLWRTDRLALALIAALLLWFGAAALVAVGSSYTVFDAIVNWYMKGFAMVSAGTIRAGELFGGHILAYPLNLQLSTAVFYMVDGDQLPGSKLLFPLLAFSLLLGAYRFLRRQAVARRFALAAVLLVATVPLFFLHATNGMANLPFTAYLVLGTLWSLEGLQARDNGRVLMGGALFAFAAWTRPEGIGFGLAMLAVLYLLSLPVLRTRGWWRALLASLAPILLFPVSWLVLLGAGEMRRDQVGGSLQGFLSHPFDLRLMAASIGQIGAYALHYFANWRSAGLLMPAALAGFLLALVFLRRRDRRLPLAMLALAAMAALVPAAMFFIVPFSDPQFAAFLDQSFDRAYLPAIVLLTLAAFAWLGHPAEPAGAALKK